MTPFWVGVAIGLGVGAAVATVVVGFVLGREIERCRDHARELLRTADDVALRARRGGL